jgi:hypothetical protein
VPGNNFDGYGRIAQAAKPATQVFQAAQAGIRIPKVLTTRIDTSTILL